MFLLVFIFCFDLNKKKVFEGKENRSVPLMTSVTTFNPADVFSQDREETPQEQDAISSIDRDYDEKDTLTVDDALGQAGVKQRQKLVVDFTNKWRGTR